MRFMILLLRHSSQPGFGGLRVCSELLRRGSLVGVGVAVEGASSSACDSSSYISYKRYSDRRGSPSTGTFQRQYCANCSKALLP
jgi:hypothetical protein